MAREGRRVDVAVRHSGDRTAWLVEIAARGAAFDRILADLDALVCVYREIEEGTYRVAWHREAALQRFAARVRACGGVVAWGGWGFLR